MRFGCSCWILNVEKHDQVLHRLIPLVSLYPLSQDLYCRQRIDLSSIWTQPQTECNVPTIHHLGHIYLIHCNRRCQVYLASHIILHPARLQCLSHGRSPLWRGQYLLAQWLTHNFKIEMKCILSRTYSWIINIYSQKYPEPLSDCWPVLLLCWSWACRRAPCTSQSSCWEPSPPIVSAWCMPGQNSHVVENHWTFGLAFLILRFNALTVLQLLEALTEHLAVLHHLREERN